MRPLPADLGDGAILRRLVIPERLGFVFDGVERGGGRGTAGYHDLNVYSMLRDGWRP